MTIQLRQILKETLRLFGNRAPTFSYKLHAVVKKRISSLVSQMPLQHPSLS